MVTDWTECRGHSQLHTLYYTLGQVNLFAGYIRSTKGYFCIVQMRCNACEWFLDKMFHFTERTKGALHIQIFIMIKRKMFRDNHKLCTEYSFLRWINSTGTIGIMIDIVDLKFTRGRILKKNNFYSWSFSLWPLLFILRFYMHSFHSFVVHFYIHLCIISTFLYHKYFLIMICS